MMISKACRLSAASRVLSALGGVAMLLVSFVLLFLGTAAPASASDCGGDQVSYQAGAAGDSCPQPTSATEAALAALGITALGGAAAPVAVVLLRGAMSGGDLLVMQQVLGTGQEAGIAEQEMQELEEEAETAEEMEAAGHEWNENLENLADAAPEFADPVVEGARATQEEPPPPHAPATPGMEAITGYNPFQYQPAPAAADPLSATAQAMAFNTLLLAAGGKATVAGIRKFIGYMQNRYGG